MIAYKVELITVCERFRIISDREVGRWVKDNLDLDNEHFSESGNINISDIVFQTREDLNLFKLAFNNKFLIEELEYEDSPEKESIA